MTHVFQLQEHHKVLVDADTIKPFYKHQRLRTRLIKMLPHWLQKINCPFRPAIVNVQFLKSLAYFTHATSLDPSKQNAKSHIASQCDHFYGDVVPIANVRYHCLKSTCYAKP